jgi:uncharacterized membrane protein
MTVKTMPDPQQPARIQALSGVGLVLGTLFFAASLTPTLIPRTALTQGVLAGLCFAAGYSIGLFLHWLWVYLELPEPSARSRRRGNALIIALCLAVAVFVLWQSTGWQNSIRSTMEMAPISGLHPIKICLVALPTFAILFALGRLFRFLVRFFATHMRRLVPPKIAYTGGVAIAILIFWLLASNVLVRAGFNTFEASFRQYDALLEPERAQPIDAMKTGSAASLINWRELGRAGREFIAAGPDAIAITAHTGRPALEPIRVYAGLRSGETAAARARLALEELKRQDAFERSVLVVVTPTGTGWVDPAALDAVEYLHEGDIASVAMQYSYLSSPLSLLVQPDYGAEAARALFTEIYAYWTALPKDHRPKLYLHGLSLGARNSERSAGLFEMISDPINGAVWSGPPFGSTLWRSITNRRNPDSPAWLPEFHDGSLVRFMNQHGSTLAPQSPWGPIRVVYLQYASDAITFFEPESWYRRPAWMEQPRGPDVSSTFRWYPIVTMLQLTLDMALSDATPMGYGHVYAPGHYVDAWVAVTGVDNWTADELSQLKTYLSSQAQTAMESDDRKEDAYANRGG